MQNLFYLCLAFIIASSSASFNIRKAKQEERTLDYFVQSTSEFRQPTSIDQIGFSIDIRAFHVSEIADYFQEHEFVFFLHFPQGEARSHGAHAILTTHCILNKSSGETGAVFCGEDGDDYCVSFQFLKHPTEKGRAGYCNDFLPLGEAMQALLAAEEPTYELALFNSCQGKDYNCL
jgi:hypothetical protein